MDHGLKRILICFLCIGLFAPLFSVIGYAAEAPSLIADYNALIRAVRDAEDGDVLLVGDIDFRPTSPSVAYNYMCVRVDTDITVKSGKADGTAAIFQNGGFAIVGSKTAGDKTTCRFENILFDGCADTASLSVEDFAYPWSDSEQTYTWHAPLKAQQAIACEGNVEVQFVGCVFRNYMHECGPVLDLRYGDYTANEYINLPDYSACTASISFESCRIENNAAFYDGGAVYVDANHNVTLTFTDTVISENRSGGGQHSGGGGAIKAEKTAVILQDCTISDNIGNHIYNGMNRPDSDQTRGGALRLSNGMLTMVNCSVKGNRASLGGALSLTNMEADIDGCRFEQNRAEAMDNKTSTTKGPWSNMAMGGAIYIEGNSNDTVKLINCEISKNSAATAYGGIYGFYSLLDSPEEPAYRLQMLLCTYRDNTVDASYTYPVEEKWLWFSHPGDITKNIHMTMLGCYMVDDMFAADFPHNESPTAENGFNFISGTANDIVMATVLPVETAAAWLSDRYGDRLGEIHVGNNYSASLYERKTETLGGDGSDLFTTDRSAWLLWGSLAFLVVVLCVGAIGAVRYHRNKPMARLTPIAETPVPDMAPTIVKMRYDDLEVDRFIAMVPETQTLTGRELEVLREILHGKKQSEVAYYLGIEITTVKDFYKKIYTKLHVDNKDALFVKASAVLKNE